MKRLMTGHFILLLAGLFICLPEMAKPQVSSKAYAALLWGLYDNTVPLIGVDELHGATDRYVILDTRSKKEYDISHIDNARWVGYKEFDLSRVGDLPLDTPIVVYCSVGVRSEEIGKRLMDAGYQKVYNLYGGIFEWANRQFPLYDMQGQPTNRVHAYSKAWGIWLRNGEKVYD